MALCPWGAAARALAGPRCTPLVWGTSLAEQWEGATVDIRAHHPQTGVKLSKVYLQRGQITALSWQQKPSASLLAVLAQLLAESENEHFPLASDSETTWRNISHCWKGAATPGLRCPVRFGKETSGFVGPLAKATPAHPCPGVARGCWCRAAAPSTNLSQSAPHQGAASSFSRSHLIPGASILQMTNHCLNGQAAQRVSS